MNDKHLSEHYSFYRSALLDDCVPFWEKHSVDYEHGGFYTCLDQKGELYNTEKSVWFQGRQTWMFARLYNDVAQKPKWLEAARRGYTFLKNHCFDSDGRMFFIVTSEGTPIRKRRYCFSECFAAIAFSEYYKASGDMEALELSKTVFSLIVDIYKGNFKTEPKFLPTATPAKSLAMPMILLSVLQCIREVCNDDSFAVLSKILTDELIYDFLKPEEQALFETVGINGQRLDSPAGRCINPGHSIEAAWFLLTEGKYQNSQMLIERALDILDWSFTLGWDKTYGGLYSFVDIEGKPPQQLEWDMKMWWPHTEALYAFLLADSLDDDGKHLQRFELIHDYSFSHFPDKEYGEWFGYLHRDGTVSNTLKGSLFKGFFHLPRALMLCMQLLEKKHIAGV